MNPHDTTPQLDLAQGFAAHAAAWAAARGAPPDSVAALRTAAAQASLATAEGHVCVRLDALAEPGPGVAELRARLLASGVVGTPFEDGAGRPETPRPPSRAEWAQPGPGGARDASAFPLVLDGQDRLYLRRHFDHERRLAAALMARAGAEAAPPKGAADAALRARLDALFAANAARLAGRPDWQKLAVVLAMERRLTVISGGPGTGKTTTVAALLACLLTAAPDLRVALAAPTGKAAARMLEALRSRAAALPPDVQGRLPGSAHTVHRLLGVTPAAGRFRHHPGNPLPVDVLVVDEASMLDLALATRLVEALPPAARLVLLGDKDQLAAVEAGAVFAELSADPGLTPRQVARLSALTGTPAEAIVPPPARAPTPLVDSVVWFSESHRFSARSGIGRLAADINAGAGEQALAWLRVGDDEAARWIEEAAAAPGGATVAEMEAGYGPYLDALRRYPGDPAAAFAALERFRVLCAVHEGPRGVKAINAHLARMLRTRLLHPFDPGAASPWYPGRPLIVLRNDPVLRLYNGDVGICLANGRGEVMVHFPDTEGGWREVAPVRLPEHDSAFAMTVHKAQGSEMESVLLLLPPAPSRVLTRELLYTGVTRAAKRVTVAGSGAVFLAACAASTARHTGLLDRMREAGRS